MPDTAVEFSEFAISYTKEARALRSEIDEAVQVTLFNVIDSLAADPFSYPHRTRPGSLTGDTLIYTHPQPPLTITYAVDEDNKIIYIIHFWAPVVQASKPLFISYSHKDEEWLVELKKWLISLERQEMIEIWDDTEIKAGDQWKEEIKKSLASAKAALLLVTQDFLASDFIAKNELPPILEASGDERDFRILWIAVSSSNVDETEIWNYQALNDPDNPLDGLSEPIQKKVLQQISKKIKKALE